MLRGMSSLANWGIRTRFTVYLTLSLSLSICSCLSIYRGEESGRGGWEKGEILYWEEADELERVYAAGLYGRTAHNEDN